MVRLVLLGGGVAAMLAACGDDRRRAECERARAELRPDAEQICQRSRSSGGAYFGSSSGRSWLSGRSTSDAGSGTVSGTSRGGFGATASSGSGS